MTEVNVLFVVAVAYT
jgi:tRNA A-37 threonylcarbamoyl transferase component Bud32